MIWIEPYIEAERYAEDRTPIIGECEHCGRYIHESEAGEAFKVSPGLFLHADCLMAYARNNWEINEGWWE